MLTVAIETVVYLCIGLIMMMLGYWIIDLFIPVDFPQEIREGNKAVGWVSAGIYAGLGFMIRSAIISISTHFFCVFPLILSFNDWHAFLLTDGRKFVWIRPSLFFMVIPRNVYPKKSNFVVP